MNQSNKKSASDRVTQSRRAYILKCAQSAQAGVTVAELTQRFGKLSRSSLIGDIEFIENTHDIKLERRGRGPTHKLVMKDADPLAGRKFRNAEHKKKLAQWCLSMVVGKPMLADGEQEVLPELVTQEIIKQAMLQSNPRGSGSISNAMSVITKLTRFWREMHRIIAIDAGSTNDEIANLLVKFDVPVPPRGGPLAALTVATNSRTIFHILGDSRVKTKVLMIGGEQVSGTQAVAGRMSELFLKAAALFTFGISFIGATDIAWKAGMIYADCHEIAALKALLFQKSVLKVIVADHTKLVDVDLDAGYEAIAIAPDQVDLIITTQRPSDPSKTDEENAKEAADFYKALNVIRAAKVPVLVVDRKVKPASKQ
ncbi:MAG: hypothetical protein K1X78_03030 [Verrucomicrobiaceae bacterium]|nr:hypothetical protein [Verrucomicrobiaceae bacterium]